MQLKPSLLCFQRARAAFALVLIKKIGKSYGWLRVALLLSEASRSIDSLVLRIFIHDRHVEIEKSDDQDEYNEGQDENIVSKL